MEKKKPDLGFEYSTGQAAAVAQTPVLVLTQGRLCSTGKGSVGLGGSTGEIAWWGVEGEVQGILHSSRELLCLWLQL